MADDSASEADSAGWETASDVDTDCESTQAPKATQTLGGKNAEVAGRIRSGTTASSSGQQSMETSNTDRVVESSATGMSADEASSAQQFEEWDVCRSLFDNHVSVSMEANLEYMFKHFGFYLPDAEYLSDPAGLLKYLVRAQSAQRAQLTAVVICHDFPSISSHNESSAATVLAPYCINCFGHQQQCTDVVSVLMPGVCNNFPPAFCSHCVPQWLYLHCGPNIHCCPCKCSQRLV